LIIKSYLLTNQNLVHPKI